MKVQMSFECTIAQAKAIIQILGAPPAEPEKPKPVAVVVVPPEVTEEVAEKVAAATEESKPEEPATAPEPAPPPAEPEPSPAVPAEPAAGEYSEAVMSASKFRDLVDALYNEGRSSEEIFAAMEDLKGKGHKAVRKVVNIKPRAERRLLKLRQ